MRCVCVAFVKGCGCLHVAFVLASVVICIGFVLLVYVVDMLLLVCSFRVAFVF